MGTPTHPGGRDGTKSVRPLGLGVSAAFLLGVVALVAIGIVSLRSIRSLVETSEWVAHTHEVLATLEAADADVTSAEASRRGYALSGAERHLDGYEIARSNIAARLDHLAVLIADDTAQQKRLIRLRTAVQVRLTALDTAIAARRTDPDPAVQAALTDEGEVLMKEVRGAIDDLSRGETVLLALRERTARASAERASLVVLLGMTVAVVTLGGSALVVARQIRARLRAEEEQRESQKSVQRLNLELAHNVAELTAVNGELEAFSYSVSHDLRAPLRHINGFVDLLQRRAGPVLDDTARRHLATIAGAAKQMGQLIDDLLAFSRMSRGELMRSRVRLSALVAEVRDGLAEDVRGRDVVWAVDGLPEVVGDPAMLRVVITNLLSNALKYSRTRERSEIAVGWRRGDDGQAHLWVRDNGVGFDMQYAGKLFGVFQRLHRVAEFEGTGIGLATVRRIVHRHGGRTWAEGAVNAGATIYFSLPLYEEGAA